MELPLFWLVFFLALGMLIGKKTRWRDAWDSLPSRLTTGGLIFLLAVMGAQLGANPELLEQIGQLGYQAVILAAAAVLGSIAAVHLLDLLWWRRRRVGGES